MRSLGASMVRDVGSRKGGLTPGSRSCRLLLEPIQRAMTRIKVTKIKSKT